MLHCLFLQIIVFSSFITSELNTSRNIKDRKNRHNVCRILTHLNEIISNKTSKLSMGLIIYAGIDEYEKEIYEIIQPKLKLDIFYYNCGSKFITYMAEKYVIDYSGNIVFANSDKCMIYELVNGEFKLKKQFDALLQKRQKKGGQSALRISRLAEETRHMYVVKIIDNLNLLNRNCKTILFGSSEITSMILSMKTLLTPIVDGGFLEFDNGTICNVRKWIEVLNDVNNNENNCKYDGYYKTIIECLDFTDKIDRLDFTKENKDNMEFYLENDNNNNNDNGNKNNVIDDKLNNKNIPFPSFESQYYSRLSGFEYIGVKYFAYENVDDCDFM